MESGKKLIGDYLVADHLINPDQLQQALNVQANTVDAGRTRLIGTILVQMGVLNEQDLAFALEEQERDDMRIKV